MTSSVFSVPFCAENPQYRRHPTHRVAKNTKIDTYKDTCFTNPCLYQITQLAVKKNLRMITCPSATDRLLHRPPEPIQWLSLANSGIFEPSLPIFGRKFIRPARETLF